MESLLGQRLPATKEVESGVIARRFAGFKVRWTTLSDSPNLGMLGVSWFFAIFPGFHFVLNEAANSIV